MMDEPGTERPSYGPVAGSPVAVAPQPSSHRGSRWPWVVTSGAVLFSLGLVANPWFETNVRTRLPASLGGGPTAPLHGDGRIAQLEARVASLESRTRAVPVTGSLPATAPERLARAEARIDGLADNQTATDQRLNSLTTDLGGVQSRMSESSNRVETAVADAATGAAQAQSILLLAATRRALEAGQMLGPLEAALRVRLPAKVALVDRIAAAGRQPVTLAALRDDFARLQPGLVADGSGQGWWAALRREIGSVVAVQRTDAATAIAPSVRIDRAARHLESGNLAAAIATIERLPGASGATAGWLAKARRLQAALSAVDQLEAEAFAPTAPLPPKL